MGCCVAACRWVVGSFKFFAVGTSRWPLGVPLRYVNTEEPVTSWRLLSNSMLGTLHSEKLDDCMIPCWAGMLHMVKLQIRKVACCR